MALAEEQQGSVLGAFRRAQDIIRSAVGVPDLSATWIQVLLLVAERPAQPLSAIEAEAKLGTSTAQWIIRALGETDRTGRPGLGLIDDVADPRNASRKLYFLTEKSRALMAEVLTELTGEPHRTYAVETALEFQERLEREQVAKPSRVDVKAFTPQMITSGKRSLARKGIEVGLHLVAFPLRPANKIIEEVDQWVRAHNGTLHRLPNVIKPDGMAIADLPDKDVQFWFHMTWR